MSQKECEEVKVRLRHKEKLAAEADGAPRVAGLCLNCAHHEAVLPETHTSRHVQAVDALTKYVMTKKIFQPTTRSVESIVALNRERDDLLAAVRALRSSQQEAQQKEWTACLQVKQAIEMAEEANLQKIQVRETRVLTYISERFGAKSVSSCV